MTGKRQYSEESLVKVMSHLTTEWQPAIDIAGWSEMSIRWTRGCLEELVKRGQIESMWDGNLGIRYFMVKKVTA